MTDEISNRTTISEATLIGLGEQWPDIKCWSPLSTKWGTANATFFVGDNDRYLLKIYGGGNHDQLRFQHRVLTHLSHAQLSYAVPFPYPSCSGDTLVTVDSTNDRLQAAVYAVIPGQSRNRGDTETTFLLGAAMGELHQALSRSELRQADAVLPAWGDLDRIHPLVTVWSDLPAQLGMAASIVERTSPIIDLLEKTIPLLQSQLPRQVVHADYVQPNVLFQDDRVSGVIDFEFATYDLRAFDLAASLYHFCLSPWNDTPRWDLLKAFLRGYGSKAELVADEIEALPTLLRWQRLSCLVYWTGMYRQGLGTYESLVAAAEENIRLESWIGQYGDPLIKRSREWLRI